jgi:polyhydroxybutyrate depolymerase
VPPTSKLGLSVFSLVCLILPACGDSADPNQVVQPTTTADSGPGAPPVNTPIGMTTNPPAMTTPNSPFDAGGVAVIDSGIASPTGEGGVASEGGTAPSAAACTGKPGMRRGKSNQKMMAGGASRSFIYYAPEGLDANKPAPLVIVPHGTNMSGAGMYDLTEYAKLADREKFVVIFPDGIDGPGSLTPWNVGEGVCGLGAVVGTSNNDLAFVDELIKFAQADQCIDEQHIFMTGFSMGGYFSNENGCMNPKIRAVAPHSGGSHDLAKCANKHKPVLIMHYPGDILIDYACGVEAKDRWIKQNGCSPTNPEVVTVKNGKCEYYKDCPPDGQVGLCSFEGGDLALPPGHCWSGGKEAGENSFAACPDGENAAELGWAFFKKYAW